MRFHKLQEAVMRGDISMGATFTSPGVMNWIQRAQRFYAGDLQSFPDAPLTEFPRLPYPCTAIEFQYNAAAAAQGHFEFCLLDEIDDAEISATTLTFFIIWADGNSAYIGTVGFDRKTGKVRHRHAEGVAGTSEEERAAAKMRLRVLALSNFLTVLNCANVTTEDVDAPARLNAKRAKGGKPPIYSYKTLVLKTAVQRVSLDGSHESPRIHLCRGHIKRRKTGNFWWQPHVRGDRKRGMVVKDYRADELGHSVGAH